MPEIETSSGESQTTATTARAKTATIVWWTGRVTGLALVLLVLVFAVGEGLPNPLRLPSSQVVSFACMFLALAGFLAGWISPRVGAALSLLGTAAFYVAQLVAWGRFPGRAIPLFWIPGLLYLAVVLMQVAADRRAGRQQGK